MQLEAKLKIARIMISHDISVVAATCKKIAVMYAGTLMETGLVEDVLVEPLHPYTRGLLKSFPAFTGEKKSVHGIPGSIPDLGALLPGCPFAPRCSFAQDICRAVEPTPREYARGQRVACHFPKGGTERAE